MLLYTTPVASFLAVTLAPGTTAPVASVIAPLMFEVAVCAHAQTARARLRHNAPSDRAKDFLLNIHSSWGVGVMPEYQPKASSRPDAWVGFGRSVLSVPQISESANRCEKNECLFPSR